MKMQCVLEISFLTDATDTKIMQILYRIVWGHFISKMLATIKYLSLHNSYTLCNLIP
jgi:hypothetical protein